MNRRAFSFAETMFAIAILGIGFTMVAMVFPLAVEQTRSNADEAVAAGLARSAFTTIQNATHFEDYPPSPGATQPFEQLQLSPIWSEVSATVINPTDGRYACIPFCTPMGNGVVQVTVLVVRRWIHDRYRAADLSGDLEPRGVNLVGVRHQSDGTDVAEIDRDSGGYYRCIAPGAFLIVTSGSFEIDGQSVIENGRIFRIGQYTSESSTSVSYSLDPARGLAPGESCDTASAAVIGRDFNDLNHPTSYAGPAQDVAVYTTYLHPN